MVGLLLLIGIFWVLFITVEVISVMDTWKRLEKLEKEFLDECARQIILANQRHKVNSRVVRSLEQHLNLEWDPITAAFIKRKRRKHE